MDQDKFREFKKYLDSEKLKNIQSDPASAIYLLDKPVGRTSFSLVAELRRKLSIKRVGFAGTLDPLASGLMILATGRATKLLDWFHFLPKVYEAVLEFGKSSDTFDREGDIKVWPRKNINQAELKKGIKKFIGQQVQTVPIFSAKKVSGKKLHVLARQGKTVDLPKNEIFIYDIKIIEYKFPILKIQVKCSSGTYIRSLVDDLGKALGTRALLIDLRRTKIGDFDVKKADQPEKLTASDLNKQALGVLPSLVSLGQQYDRLCRE